MPARLARYLLSVLMLPAMALMPAHAQHNTPSAESFYETGLAHYRAGRIEQALNEFVTARSRGLRSPNLDFNIGLAYYKLKRYPAAEATFQQLRHSAGYEAIANFHLALIALRTGRRAEAAALLNAAEAGATPALQQRIDATRALAFGAAPRPLPSVYLSLGIGHDSNPALISTDFENVQSDSDAFAEAIAYGRYPFWVRPQRSAEISAGLYLKQFNDQSSLDQRGMQAGLRHEWRRQGWRFGVAAQGERADIDGEEVQSAAILGFDASIGRQHRWVLGYSAAAISAGDDYSYLEGQRHRLNLGYSTLALAGRAGLAYEIEYNDRDDFRNGQEFFSHSPTRHRVTLSYERDWSTAWSTQMQVRYRNSRYDDANRFLVNGTLMEAERDEDLLEGTVGLRYRLAPGWSVLGQYEYNDNDSNVDGFSYERHVGLLALEWQTPA